MISSRIVHASTYILALMHYPAVFLLVILAS
jgi:hypothetical protein